MVESQAGTGTGQQEFPVAAASGRIVAVVGLHTAACSGDRKESEPWPTAWHTGSDSRSDGCIGWAGEVVVGREASAVPEVGR